MRCAPRSPTIEDVPKLMYTSPSQDARLDGCALRHPAVAVRDACTKGQLCLAGISVHRHGGPFAGCCRFTYLTCRSRNILIDFRRDTCLCSCRLLLDPGREAAPKLLQLHLLRKQLTTTSRYPRSSHCIVLKVLFNNDFSHFLMIEQ